jgi:hypothetical protein
MYFPPKLSRGLEQVFVYGYKFKMSTTQIHLSDQWLEDAPSLFQGVMVMMYCAEQAMEDRLLMVFVFAYRRSGARWMGVCLKITQNSLSV